MASRTPKQPKGRNGVGDSVTVFFDKTDPAERRALEAARLLAAKHGRRKSAIIALLEAVYAHYEQTGELMSSAEITGALNGRAGGVRNSVTSSPAVPQYREMQYSPEEPSRRNQTPIMTSKRKSQRQHPGDIEIIPDGKASAQKVADNFLSSMKGFATDFFG
jgi:hypothetical protein